MPEIDLESIEQSIRSAVEAQRAWRRQLNFDPAQACKRNPWGEHRTIATRVVWQQVQEFALELPPAGASANWIASLTIDRVTHDELRELELSRLERKHAVPALGQQLMSMRDLVLCAVVHPDASARRIAASAAEFVGDEVSSNALFLLARQREAARQLGLQSLDGLSTPASNITMREVAGLVAQRGHSWSQLTGVAPGTWHDFAHSGCATQATAGWPAHLTARWLHDLTKGGELTAGLSIDPGEMPKALCAASFARALSQFGLEIYRAAARNLAPMFSLAQRPYDAAPYGYGALIASWLCSPAFARRHLGLGGDNAKLHCREMIRSFAVNVRLLALQAAQHECDQAEQVIELTETLSSEILGVSIPPELTGVVPRCRQTAAARLLGVLWAASKHAEMVERFDDDWFDNPQAHRTLREIDVSTRLTLGVDDVTGALAKLSGALEQLCA